MKKTDNYDPIPETVQDALKKWDHDETVFSVEMGGLGPGYEMAIQGLAFEIMRKISKEHFTHWGNKKKMESFDKLKLDPVVHKMSEKPWGGFSGAQVGAAKSLAAIVCRKGYRKALRMDAVKDRLIQVCRRDLRSNGAIGK